MTLLQRTVADTRYVMTGFMTTVVGFVLVVAGVAAGLGSAAVFVGLPILAMTALLARRLADTERGQLPEVLGRPVGRPEYAEAPIWAGWFRRTMTPLGTGQAVLDILHAIISLPFAIVSFVLTTVWWAGTIAGLTFPLYGWILADTVGVNASLPALLGLSDSPTMFVLFNTGLGLAFAATLMPMVRIAALVRATLAQSLLTRPARKEAASVYAYPRQAVRA
ncbi:sensor domain-containing protein [Nonomuraea longicatena]|uniref:Putative sensor domain-containing protein n=1 Tax=Nonomuraea longicatena TaxID=83682 RepID=A0ABN1QKY6_9ACTN